MKTHTVHFPGWGWAWFWSLWALYHITFWHTLARFIHYFKPCFGKATSTFLFINTTRNEASLTTHSGLNELYHNELIYNRKKITGASHMKQINIFLPYYLHFILLYLETVHLPYRRAFYDWFITPSFYKALKRLWWIERNHFQTLSQMVLAKICRTLPRNKINNKRSDIKYSTFWS